MIIQKIDFGFSPRMDTSFGLSNLPQLHVAHITAILSTSMAVVMVTYKCRNQLLTGPWFQSAQRFANHLL